MELTYFDVPITKTEKQADGSVLVWGPCTTDDIDSDKQIIDPEFASKGLGQWLKTGANIREMHQPKAIGTGVELVREGNQHWLKGRIVEPTAANLALEKILRAWSVGISAAKIDYTKNPQARGGTIVDGVFVEVSLVDRPANATCKVDVVTKMDNGNAHFTDIVEKADKEPKDCPTCKGKGTIKEGNMKCPDCNGTGNMTAEKRFAERAAELVREMAASTVKDGKDSDGDKIPDNDEKVTEALTEAQQAQAADNAEHQSGDGEDAEKVEKDEAPYVVKRFHDYLCAAYTAESLKAAYPTVDNFHDVIDPHYWAQRVTETILDDAGSGKNAALLARASEMYGLVVDMNKADSEVVTEAKAVLEKAFADTYPSVHLTPGSITAGQFKRPYLTAGRQPMTAHGIPRMPMAANVPSAGQFDRGPLTDGRQRPAPMTGPPNAAKIDKLDCTVEAVEAEGITVFKMTHTPTGEVAQGATPKDAWKSLKDVVKDRQFYTNNSRDQMLGTIKQAHDLLAAAHPGCCPMSTKVDEPIDSPIETGKPTSDHTEVMPNHDDAMPKPATVKVAGLDAETQKMFDTAVTEAVRTIEKEHDRKIKKLKRKLAAAETERAELAKLADPEAVVYRGGRGVIPSVAKNADDAQDSAELVKAVEKRETVEWLLDRVQNPQDHATQRAALEKLQELLTPDEFAAALVMKTT